MEMHQGEEMDTSCPRSAEQDVSIPVWCMHSEESIPNLKWQTR